MAWHRLSTMRIDSSLLLCVAAIMRSARWLRSAVHAAAAALACGVLALRGGAELVQVLSQADAGSLRCLGVRLCRGPARILPAGADATTPTMETMSPCPPSEEAVLYTHHNTHLASATSASPMSDTAALQASLNISSVMALQYSAVQQRGRRVMG